MRNNSFIVFAALICFLLLNGCKKDDATAPSPKVTGDLMGTVQLRNEKGVYASNHSAITVSVEGTNLSSQTDEGGNYSIKGIEEGDKIIVYSKNGYGTFKEVIHIDGNSTKHPNGIDIFELPPFNVKNLSAKIITNGFELSGGITNTLDDIRGLVVFAFSDSTVSSEPSKYLFAKSYTIMHDSSSFTASVWFSDLLQNGFKSGQKVYFVAYGSISTGYSGTYYWDIKNNKTFYCCLSKTSSNKINISIP